MDVALVTPAQVSESALRSLGLVDAGVGLFSAEALAASLRRAASFLCPCTPGQLVRSVAEALNGLPGYGDDTPHQLSMLTEALTGYGDLLELPADGQGGGRRLFLGAPAYVWRSSGACLLVGIRPDGADLAGDDLTGRIDYEGHARIVPPSSDLRELLAASSVRELSASQWLRAPRAASADELLADYQQRLEAAGDSGEIDRPRILDPASSVTYYRGRWRSPVRTDTGDFVARRPQAYGADLWCYARVASGNIIKLVDVPVRGSLLPGADEAWRLQAAIDKVSGHPQQVRMRAGPTGTTVLDFVSPVPSWAQRRLDILGTPLLHGQAALFSYSLPATEAAEELRFLADMLWITASYQAERTGP